MKYYIITTANNYTIFTPNITEQDIKRIEKDYKSEVVEIVEDKFVNNLDLSFINQNKTK